MRYSTAVTLFDSQSAEIEATHGRARLRPSHSFRHPLRKVPRSRHCDHGTRYAGDLEKRQRDPSLRGGSADTAIRVGYADPRKGLTLSPRNRLDARHFLTKLGTFTRIYFLQTIVHKHFIVDIRQDISEDKLRLKFARTLPHSHVEASAKSGYLGFSRLSPPENLS